MSRAEESVLMKAWVDHPQSAYIRDDLQNQRAKVCEHGRNPCYLKCGVRRNLITGEWSIIPRQRRREWLDAVMA